MTILKQTISGLCSAGKTESAIRAIDSSNELNFIFVLPSTDASNELAARLKQTNESINAIVINSKTTDDNMSALNQFISLSRTHESTPFKKVLVITHKLYDMLPAELVQKWNVYYDELVDAFNKFSASFSSEGVTFDSNFSINNGLLVLNEDIAAIEYDGGKNREIQELILKLKSGRYDISVISKPGDIKAKPHLGLFIAVPNNNYFIGGTVTVLGADISSCPIVSKCTVQEAIELEPRISNHTSNKIKIKYVFDKTSNTRTFRDTNPELIKKANDLIVDDLSGHKALLWMNDNNPHQITGTQITRLNHNVFGADNYRDYAAAIFLSSMNMNDKDLSTLNKMHGIDPEVVYWRNTIYTAYQCIMRGNLRSQSDTEGFTIYVYDLKLASALKLLYFPNATLSKIGNIVTSVAQVGRPVLGLTDQDKSDNKQAAQIKYQHGLGWFNKNHPELHTILLDMITECSTLSNTNKPKLNLHQFVSELKKAGLWDKFNRSGKWK